MSRNQEDVRMSATNGSLRSRSRLIGLALAAVFALGAMFASAASATPVKETTLALGDSLAFGYSAQTFNQHLLEGVPATAFETGYANQYQTLHKAKAAGSQLVNLGCPGETTDSMIGNGALGAVLDPSTGEAPCAYRNVTNFPLHHEYGAGKSQLEAALEQIGLNASKGTPVTKVTFNIGANDQLHAIAKCEAEVKEEIQPEKGKFFSKYGGKANSEAGAGEAIEAQTDGAEAKVAFEKGENALGAELKAEAEEDGAAAAADFHHAGEEAVKGCIEAHVEELFKHILHNVGSIMFALRNGSAFGSINYTGPVLFQGGYDPYGNVYLTEEEVAAAHAAGPQFATAKLGELLPGSNSLAAILNFHMRKLLTDEGTEALEEGHEAFHGCFSNPKNNEAPGLTPTQTLIYSFNPPVLKKEAGATGNLQKYTNMNNQTVTTYPEVTKIAPRPNGPDIHPTTLGYSRLAKIMTQECG